MKKIIVFGATGGTGKETVLQALGKGYEVTALVRNPAAFKLEHPHLIILQGDVTQPFTLEKAIAGMDAVISCLGNGKSTKPTTVYSAGIKNIISAMDVTGTKRLLCVSATALEAYPEMGMFVRFFTKNILQKILKEPYADMRLMEAEVQRCDLSWTIVCPPMLKDKRVTGKYRVAMNVHLNKAFSIARADVAHFLIASIDDPETFRSKIEIAN